MCQKSKEVFKNECNIIKQELTCRICLDLYTEPITLITCQHSFCSKCFKELFIKLKSPKQQVCCPICKNLTNRRSNYLNDQLKATVTSYKMFSKLIESWDEGMEYLMKNNNCIDSFQNNRLNRYLDDCVDRMKIIESLPAIEDDDDNDLIMISTPKANRSSKKQTPKLSARKMKSLNTIKKSKRANKSNKTKTKTNNEKVSKINEIDEDNKIVKLIEDDFLQNIENEFQNEKKYEDKVDGTKKSPSSGWSRMKTLKKQIKKKETRYKQLNVSAESNKSVKTPPNNNKSPDLLEENVEVNETHIEVEVKAENVSGDKLDLVLQCLEEQNEEDIFSIITQKLNENENNSQQNKENLDVIEIFSSNASAIAEGAVKKINDNDIQLSNKKLEDSIKMVVNVEVHTSLSGPPTVSPKSSKESFVLSNRIRIIDQEETPTKRNKVEDLSLNNSKQSISHRKTNEIEETPISIKQTNKTLSTRKTNKRKLEVENNSNQSFSHITNERDISVSIKQMCEKKETSKVNKRKLSNDSILETNKKNELKSIINQQTSIISSFEKNLNTMKKVLSHCSSVVASSSLFSDSTKESKPNSENNQTNLSKNEFYSLPILVDSKSSLGFYSTVIPYLKDVEMLCNQMDFLNQQISNSTTMKTILDTNEDETKTKDVEIQTDLLECPKCHYNFDIKLNKTPKVILENFNKLTNKSFSSKTSENSSILAKKVNRQLNFGDSTTKKQKYKRIRSPTPDSETDSTLSKKSKNNYSKLLYRDDIDVIFNSELSDRKQNKEDDSQKKSKDIYIEKILENYNKDMQETLHAENIVSLLEREYKEAKFANLAITADLTNKISGQSDDIDEVLGNMNLSALESSFNNKNGQKHSFSNSLFTENQKINNISEEELDKEVANITSVNDLDNDSDKDIFVESTPEKLNLKIIEPPKIIREDWINIAPLPPPEFQDSEQVYISGTKHQNTSIISTNPLNANIFDHDFEEKENITPKNKTASNVETISRSGNKTLNPIVLAQNEKYSPLQIIRNLNIHKTVTSTPKQQNSILNYLKQPKPLKEDIQIEVCESPIPERNVSVIPDSPAKIEINKMNIVSSRLKRDEMMAILALSSKFHLKRSNYFSSSVTHLVVSVDEKNRILDHTMKYILGIANSIWIVSFAWVRDCLEQNRILPEEDYEVFDVSGIPGPKNSRLNRLKQPLFENFVIYCPSPFININKNELENVITNLGGEIQFSLNYIQKSSKICLILTEAKITQDFDQYQIWRNKYNVLVVDVEWLSRSVGQYHIISVRPYILCLEDGIDDLGYPSDLIAPVAESQMTNSVN